MDTANRPLRYLPCFHVVPTVGRRLAVGLVAFFAGTLAHLVWVYVDHATTVLSELGAPQAVVASVRAGTIWLMVMHGTVAILLFATLLYLSLRRLSSRGIKAIPAAFNRQDLGSQAPALSTPAPDEMDWIAATSRTLWDGIEDTPPFNDGRGLATEAQSEGSCRESVLASLARRVLTIASARVGHEADGWEWIEVEQAAMRMLALVGGPGGADGGSRANDTGRTDARRRAI